MEHVKADYLRRGFIGRVGFGKKPCLLVVDLNKGFTDPTTPVGADLTDVINRTNELLDIARLKGIKIVFTAIAYNNPDEIGLWVKKIPALKCLLIGTGLEEIDERLNRQASESVFVKKFGSSFMGTTLLHELILEGIDTLIITGTSTSGCIRATAIDALQYGFRTVIPREAVGDRAHEPHEANLFDINAKYGDVVALAEVKEYLQRIRFEI